MAINAKELFKRRQRRNRHALSKVGGGKPRLSVFRSGRHIYAQIINDAEGRTIAQASTVDKELRAQISKGATAEAAASVGKLIGERAVAAGIDKVVFDRGGYRFHGRVKALAEAAREAGLVF